VSSFIEDRHELKLKRRLADIRPWTEKAAEMLSDRFILTLWVAPLLVVSVMLPLFAPATLGLAAVIIVTHRRIKPLLPMRYPAMNKMPDPASGKPGTGILFFGSQESSSPYENFKEIWASDDDLRKHMLILGSTGSGKSELLKSLFFNALCWSSGFFIADGKADNKLPTDVFTMVRSVGMDDNLLTLNFLLAGKTPEQVRRSRRRRTNKLNPFTSADADTIIQMGANMLPKVEGDGKNWQEKALNLWRAMVVALCYKRDTQGFDLSVSTLVDYMNLAKIEELYIEGYDEAQKEGEWSYGFISIKTYLDSGCPAYKVDKLLAKFGREAQPAAQAAFGAARPKANSNEQDSMAYEQHAYRTSQLMPVLNLLDKTYGHIFRDKYPEIDMVDVTLNNRIMTMLIPSLEKSAQEAENLGKLAIACLRVMMSRNLGGGVEGTRAELLESKATNSPYPYLVALDELGYYFSDGIAVIFAQARSLGFCMIPAAQDLEKLTEGSSAAEAGAMMANAVTKVFMRIDDAKKTYEFVQGVVGKAVVPIFRSFEFGDMGWRRKTEVDVQEVERVSMKDLQAMQPGQGLINGLGRSTRFRAYYMDNDLKKHRADSFYVLRFLQVPPPSKDQINAYSIPYEVSKDPYVKGERLRAHLSLEMSVSDSPVPRSEVISAVSAAAQLLPAHLSAEVRAVVLFEAARRAVSARQISERAAIDREADLLGTRMVGGRPGPVPPSTRPETRSVPSGTALPPSASAASRQETAQPASQPAFGTRVGDSELAREAVGQDAYTTPQDSIPEELDLEALLSPTLPFKRKAVEEFRQADQQDSVPAPRDSAPIVDPVESFLSGIRFFNMPSLPGEEPAGSDKWDQGALDHVLAPSMQLQAPSQAPSLESLASRASPDIDWIAQAVQASTASADVASSDRTAMGFVPTTMQQLQDIEALLGNPQPAQAVRSLEKVVSHQITPRASAPLAKEDWEIDQLLKDLDSI